MDEKTRQSLYKLRQTWNDIFPERKLYALDLKVNQIDPAWPITASPPADGIGNIHVNPKFLKVLLFCIILIENLYLHINYAPAFKISPKLPNPVSLYGIELTNQV